ncbi:glycerate kinase type-2 family protein [Microbacterium tumbae]
MKIRNSAELTARGDATGRALVLEIVEDALARVDAYPRIRDLVRVEEDVLHVGDREWALRPRRRIYLIGAGKAANAMALAVEHALGDRLTRGIAIVKIAEPDDGFTCTEVHVGGHPLPDRASYDATRKILDLVDSSGPGDLFIVVVSGGSSALMSAPIEPITVDDEARATEVLLTSGLGIAEINAVRRHISRTNGGRLAQRILARGAELIGLGISDAVGRPATGRISEPAVSYTGTPIGPDPTTLSDARAVIDEHALRDRMPRRVVDFLDGAGPEWETPDSLPGATYFLVNTLPDLSLAAVEAARALGVEAHVLTTFLEGESRDAGTFLAALAREIQANARPFSPPCLVISGGETVTHIREDAVITGHGGPSQELALGFAMSIRAVPGACLYAMDSEGTDGTSPAAGGLTDSTSAARAAELGVDIRAHLRGHAAYEALTAMGDVVLTGNTGTNLCDLNVMYVPALEPTR